MGNTTAATPAIQKTEVKKRPARPPSPDALFLTDRDACALFRVGIARWFEMQKTPGFPPPIWIGPRGKRHVRSELLAWAAAQRNAPA
jgi:predicted DNA-binding transcriptional regulator AlpA